MDTKQIVQEMTEAFMPAYNYLKAHEGERCAAVYISVDDGIRLLESKAFMPIGWIEKITDTVVYLRERIEHKDWEE
jgi:hypothetical protein